MKVKKFIITMLSFAMIAFTGQSCLDGGNENFPKGGSKPFLTLSTYDGVLPSPTGLPTFGNQALVFVDSEPVTYTLVVALQGVETSSSDINFDLRVNDLARFQDNFDEDGITYTAFPTDAYEISATSGVIEKGTNYFEFEVTFFPDKVDGKESNMLTIEPVISGSSNVTVSSNQARAYFHTIGNAIAGPYNWDFIRCSDPECAGGPDGLSFSGDHTLFLPLGATKIAVPMGYYDNSNYIITFDDDGEGNLSNFNVVIQEATDWAAAGISVVTGPTITVEDNNTKFTINFTTATRNCTDVYYK